MSKKNIVSIEDRIPKLKQARKKKANRRLIFYLSIFFFLISIIIYLQSPLSHIKTIQVNGNSYTTDEEIIKQSGLTKDTNIWTIDKTEIEQAISEDPIIKTVSIDRNLPWTVEINLTEQEIVGYIKDEASYYPLLENGKTFDSRKQDSYNGNAPLMIGFTEDDYLLRMSSELEKLPKSILNLISEIHWQPTDDNKQKILLYMNDGFIVDGTIRNFSDDMKVYPSIVSQLEPDREGIIHIGVGVYFEPFEQEQTEEASASEEMTDEAARE